MSDFHRSCRMDKASNGQVRQKVAPPLLSRAEPGPKWRKFDTPNLKKYTRLERAYSPHAQPDLPPRTYIALRLKRWLFKTVYEYRDVRRCGRKRRANVAHRPQKVRDPRIDRFVVDTQHRYPVPTPTLVPGLAVSGRGKQDSRGGGKPCPCSAETHGAAGLPLNKYGRKRLSGDVGHHGVRRWISHGNQ